jgi:hypothetical protein
MSEKVEAEPESELGAEVEASPGKAALVKLFAGTRNPRLRAREKEAARARVAWVHTALLRLTNGAVTQNKQAQFAMFMASEAHHRERSFALMEHYMTLSVKHIEANGPDDLKEMVSDLLTIVSFALPEDEDEDEERVPPGVQAPLERIAEDVLSAPALEGGGASAAACD